MDAVFLVTQPDDRKLAPLEILQRMQSGLMEASAMSEGQEVEIYLAQALCVDESWGERIEHAAKISGVRLVRVR